MLRNKAQEGLAKTAGLQTNIHHVRHEKTSMFVFGCPQEAEVACHWSKSWLINMPSLEDKKGRRLQN